MIPSKMDLLMRFHGGGGSIPKPKPPPPPAPTTAAENLAKNNILERQRKARGHGSTLIGSLMEAQRPATFMKQLLGE